MKYRVVWKEEQKKLVTKNSDFINIEDAQKLRKKLKNDKTGLPVWIEDQNYNEYDEDQKGVE